MRNKYPGTCYRCGKHVEVGDGHFERYNGGWRTQHASCAILHRKEPRETTSNERTKARKLRRDRQKRAVFGVYG